MDDVKYNIQERACNAMLKPEYIKNLKQTNISNHPDKSKDRIREAWTKSSKSDKDKILELCGVKKPSIARAYTSGNVSAKIVAAMAQVLEKDPLYLAGNSDEQRIYSDDIVEQFLINLGYEIGNKSKVRKQRGGSNDVAPIATEGAEAGSTPDGIVTESPVNNTLSTESESSTPKQVTCQCDELKTLLPEMLTMSGEVSDLMNTADLEKIKQMTEEELILLLRSLCTQATYYNLKQRKLTLIKCLLLQ